MTQRVAILLFNLGGPDSPQAVQPFLQNLFSDPAIIRAPALIRWMLARLISYRRAPVARKIYAHMGGRSPILENTQAQAQALEAALGPWAKCFIAMRYWHPRLEDILVEIEDYKPDKVVLLPLYPQYSSTTTASSFAEYDKAGVFKDKTVRVNCYPGDPWFIKAQADLIRPQLEAAKAFGTPRLLLSAHGLPEKIVNGGDPYQSQCERTAQAILAALDMPGLDALNCYQSRVGPMKWIGPSTEDEIARAGADKVPVVLAPIAFVSEHSETLVELDIEYRELAHEKGVPYYGRVPTVGTHPDFIAALALRVQQALAGTRAAVICPPEFDCPCRRENHGSV